MERDITVCRCVVPAFDIASSSASPMDGVAMRCRRRARSTTSALLMRMHPCDAGAPSRPSDVVPWM